MRPSLDKDLVRGADAYEDVLGSWWQRQSGNPAHRRAYRRVAEYLASSFPAAPRLVVDYACGAGGLLRRLADCFPRAGLIGLDGSEYLLSIGRKRLHRASHACDRIALKHTLLPDFDLRLKADLVIYAFPNMIPQSARSASLQIASRLHPDDLDTAEALVLREKLRSRPADRHEQAALLWNRLISLNLRKLLRRGGHCARVEYGRVPRDHMSRSDFLRAGFEEGSADPPDGDGRPWFRVAASASFRSAVAEDVYHQSRNPDDRKGGYTITILRAV